MEIEARPWLVPAAEIEVGDLVRAGGEWWRIVGQRVLASSRWIVVTAETLDGMWSSSRSYPPDRKLRVSDA